MTVVGNVTSKFRDDYYGKININRKLIKKFTPL